MNLGVESLPLILLFLLVHYLLPALHIGVMGDEEEAVLGPHCHQVPPNIIHSSLVKLMVVVTLFSPFQLFEEFKSRVSFVLFIHFLGILSRRKGYILIAK